MVDNLNITIINPPADNFSVDLLSNGGLFYEGIRTMETKTRIKYYPLAVRGLLSEIASRGQSQHINHIAATMPGRIDFIRDKREPVINPRYPGDTHRPVVLQLVVESFGNARILWHCLPDSTIEQVKALLADSGPD